MLRPFLAACLAALALPAQQPGDPPPPQPGAATPAGPQEGDTCPPGRWYTQAGNACRNASSANAPLLRRPTARWRVALDGELVGEPLVWDQLVCVELRRGDQRRALQLRRRADGSLLAERAVVSRAELSPSLWNDEVIVRIADHLERLRLDGQRLNRAAGSTSAKTSLGPPLRLGTRVYAIVDGRVTCMRAADFREEWCSKLDGYAGTVSVRGDMVYALRSAGRVGWLLKGLDRATGTDSQTGPPLQIKGAPGEDTWITLAGDEIRVQLGAGRVIEDFATEAGVHPDVVNLPLLFHENSEPRLTIGDGATAADARHQIAVLSDGKDLHLGLSEAGRAGIVQLDTRSEHTVLVGRPPTLCGDVFYLGACATSANDLRVLWRHPATDDTVPGSTRAVPAGDLLLFGGGTQLTALGGAPRDDTIAIELADRLHAHERQRLRALVDDAVAAADWPLARELLTRCRELLVDEAWAQKRDRDLGTGSKKPRVRPDDNRSRAVRVAADAVAREALDQVQQHVATWPGQRPAAQVRSGLRFVLDQQPEHTAAAALVRSMLPASLAAPDQLDARQWLSFLDATEQTRVAFFDANLSDPGLDWVALHCKQQLDEYRHSWRGDLQALIAERLLLFSPLDAPGSLALALSTGELVCDTLEAMFAGLPQTRQDARPMILFVYQDRDEYLRESAKIGHTGMEWTAGYYSDERVPKSRMFVPTSATGFAEVLPTMAHELTHQWLMDRCPAFVPDGEMVWRAPRAAWIAEGFACLIEQFDFDLAKRTARLADSELAYADLLAAVPPRLMLDWNWLVRSGRDEFTLLQHERGDPPVVPSILRLGMGRPASRVAMYYAQAAMLCRYLYEGEGGARRQQLLDYVIAFYTGTMEDLDFTQAFGCTAKELGPRVVEFARQLVH